MKKFLSLLACGALLAGFATASQAQMNIDKIKIGTGNGNYLTLMSGGAASSWILTLPDPGGAANVILSTTLAGSQTINGTFHFSGTVNFEGPAPAIPLASGDILVGNGAGTSIAAPVALSLDATIDNTGALTVTGSHAGTFAVQSAETVGTTLGVTGVATTGGLTDHGATDIEGTTTINTGNTVATSIGNSTGNLTLTGKNVDIEDNTPQAVDINTTSGGPTAIGGTLNVLGITTLSNLSTNGVVHAISSTGQLASSAVVNGDLLGGVYGAITGLGSQSQALNMNTHQINGVVDPTSAQDAATKFYVDGLVGASTAAGTTGQIAIYTGTNAIGGDANITDAAGTVTVTASSAINLNPGAANNVTTNGSYNVSSAANSYEIGGSTVLSSPGSGAGSWNTFVGVKAGNTSFTPGSARNDIAIGWDAMLSISTGNDNVAVGYSSLANTSTGVEDVGIGSDAGGNNIGGNDNTYLGREADAGLGDNNLNNTTALGYQAKVTASNMVQLGNVNVALVNTSGAINTSHASGYELSGTSVLSGTTLGSTIVTSSLAALGTQSQALDMGTTHKIINLATPTALTDAATKGYVDGLAGNYLQNGVVGQNLTANTEIVTGSFKDFTVDGSGTARFGTGTGSTYIGNNGTWTYITGSHWSVDGSNGNASFDGTLHVSGAATIIQGLNANGLLTVGTNLNPGQINIDGTVGSASITYDNTNIVLGAGLSVTNNATVGGTLGVTGVLTLGNNATDGALKIYNTGNLTTLTAGAGTNAISLPGASGTLALTSDITNAVGTGSAGQLAVYTGANSVAGDANLNDAAGSLSYGSDFNVTEATGRTGIGAAAYQGSKLEVIDGAANTSNGSPLVLESNNGANAMQLSVTRNASNYFAVNVIEQGVGSKNLVLMNSGGNVGVGTTTPISLLANTNGNTIFPGSSQGTGAGGLTWAINNGGYAVSITNTDLAASAHGLGVEVTDNTAGTFALNVTNTSASLFSVTGDGNTTVNATNGFGLTVTGENQTALKVGKSNATGNGAMFISSDDPGISANLFYDGSNWKYDETSLLPGVNIDLSSGGFSFANAVANTAGNNATLIQRMALDANGNLDLPTGGVTSNVVAAIAFYAQNGGFWSGTNGTVAGTLGLSDAGSAFAGTLKTVSGLGNNRTYSLPDATGTIALTSDITSALSNYLPLAGGTMSGAIDMGTKNITNGGAGSFASLATTSNGNVNLNGTGEYQIAGNQALVVNAAVFPSTYLGKAAGNGPSSTNSASFAVGSGALGSMTSGGDNLAVGFVALSGVQDGYDNSAYGSISGGGIVHGHDNTFLGRFAQASGDYNYATAIGVSASVTGSNQMQLGSASGLSTLTLVNTSGAFNTSNAGGYELSGTSVLSGTTLGSTIVNSSLTSVGTLTNLTVTNPISGSVTGSAANVTGIVAVAHGGTGSDLSASGGVSGDVLQEGVAGTFTVGQLSSSQLSDGSSLVTTTTINNNTLSASFTTLTSSGNSTIGTGTNLTNTFGSGGGTTTNTFGNDATNWFGRNTATAAMTNNFGLNSNSGNSLQNEIGVSTVGGATVNTAIGNGGPDVTVSISSQHWGVTGVGAATLDGQITTNALGNNAVDATSGGLYSGTPGGGGTDGSVTIASTNTASDGTLVTAPLTGPQTYTLPDASGTIALTSDITNNAVAYGGSNNTLTTGATNLFNVSYGSLTDANAAGAVISSDGSTGTNGNATGLTVTATAAATKAATGLSISATGGGSNRAIDITNGSLYFSGGFIDMNGQDINNGGQASFTALTSSGNSTIGTGPSLTNTFGTGTGATNTIGEASGTNQINGATTATGTMTVVPTGGSYNEGISIAPSTADSYSEVFYQSQFGTASSHVWYTGHEPNHHTYGDYMIGFQGLTGMVGTSAGDRALEIDPLDGSAVFGGALSVSGALASGSTGQLGVDASGNLTTSGFISTTNSYISVDEPSAVTPAISITSGAIDIQGTSGHWSVDNTGNITTNQSISATTALGTITAGGLLTGSAGATISGATISLNDASNFNTNINTGTSTGTVAIGNALSTSVVLSSLQINLNEASGAGATNIGFAGSPGSGTVSIDAGNANGNYIGTGAETTYIGTGSGPDDIGATTGTAAVTIGNSTGPTSTLALTSAATSINSTGSGTLAIGNTTGASTVTGTVNIASVSDGSSTPAWGASTATLFESTDVGVIVGAAIPAASDGRLIYLTWNKTSTLTFTPSSGTILGGASWAPAIGTQGATLVGVGTEWHVVGEF